MFQRELLPVRLFALGSDALWDETKQYRLRYTRCISFPSDCPTTHSFAKPSSYLWFCLCENGNNYLSGLVWKMSPYCCLQHEGVAVSVHFHVLTDSDWELAGPFVFCLNNSRNYPVENLCIYWQYLMVLCLQIFVPLQPREWYYRSFPPIRSGHNWKMPVWGWKFEHPWVQEVTRSLRTEREKIKVENFNFASPAWAEVTFDISWWLFNRENGSTDSPKITLSGRQICAICNSKFSETWHSDFLNSAVANRQNYKYT